MGTVGRFNFDVSHIGAKVIDAETRSQLSNHCLTDSEVDHQIKLLKEDLDAVAKRMKRAISEQRKINPLDEMDAQGGLSREAAR